MLARTGPVFFISHVHGDARIAEALGRLVEKAFYGNVEAWFSSDERSDGGLIPGKQWFAQVSNRLRQATCLFAVVTDKSLESKWIHWESGIGYDRGAQVIPVTIGLSPGNLQPPLSLLQGVDGLDASALSSTLRKVAETARLKLVDDQLYDMCKEFAAAATVCLETSSPSPASRPATDVDIGRLEKKIDRLIGLPERPLTLEIDQAGTKPLDSATEATVLELGYSWAVGTPLRADVERNLARALFGSGDLMQALIHQHEVAASENATANDWNTLGVILLLLGEAQQAEDAFRRALDMDPECARFWFNVGYIMDETGRKKKAKEAYMHAVRLDSKLFSAWCNLGLLHQDAKRYKSAEECLLKARDAEPSFDWGWRNLGVLYELMDRNRDAEDMHRQALKLSPDSAITWYNLGVVLKKVGRLDEAKESYLKAIKYDPECANAWSNLGNIYWQERNLRAAEDAFRRSIKAEPSTVEAWCNLAMLLLSQSRRREAEEVLAYAKATLGIELEM
jgi:tetratricopeptide (TPR) repeat protein